MKNPLILALLLLVSSFASYSQPGNDLCTSPTTLPVPSTFSNTAGTLFNSTLTTTVTGVGTCGDNKRDVWYRFTVPALTTQVNIRVALIGGATLLTNTNTFIELLDGNNCPTTGTSRGCADISTTRSFSNLTPGGIYLFRVLTDRSSTTAGVTGDYDFNVAVSSNDNCASPPSVTANGSCISGTLYGASANPVTWTGGPGSRRDVWYSVAVPAGVTTLTARLTLSWPGEIHPLNTFVELFNNTACPATLSLGSFDIANLRAWSGLTGGTNYLMRVSTTHPDASTDVATKYNFNLCLSSIANNECSGAATLTVGGAPVEGTLLTATASATIPLGCAIGTPDDDVWYRFTPTLNYAAISLQSIGGDLANTGAQLQVFSGSCGTLTSVGCGTNYVSLTGLAIGSPYFIRVYSRSTGQTGDHYGFKIVVTPSPVVASVTAGRMKEVYQQQVISPGNAFLDPWELTYGPDGKLWVTESKGYRVYKVNPVDGARDMILDVSLGSNFLPLVDRSFNCTFNDGSGAQGGFAGLALHPKFLDPTTPKNFVYVSYVHSQTTTNYFVNRVVRFTYNTSTGKLESPVSLCDTLPGSNDHNSQRMIIAPVGGVYYLFYAQGDMGAGQFANTLRPQKAQDIDSYEGKILRFNLESDGDAGLLDRWIPSTGSGDATNPFNAALAKQSAVWATGIRNNQGFAYDETLGKLYGSSHGPYSDDEINVIERGMNYGHPLVIGYTDGNANGTTAGAAPNFNPAHPSSCPVITDEAANAASLGASYRDPLFSAYANSLAFPSLKALWDVTTGNNSQWPSEGWSGLELYQHTLVPGWKNSLIATSLKWGRLVRVRLNALGTMTAPSNTAADTVSYLGSVNRYRDIAFLPNGKDMFVIMDRGSSGSGPAAANPIVPGCAGCLQRYTFLGYADSVGLSTLQKEVDVTVGVNNTCNTGTTVTVDNNNNMYWVPITGPDGNIVAEVFPNGQNLGTITSSFYKNAGALRVRNGVSYADRNITITPQNQPSGTVRVRLYLTKAEYDAFDVNPLSGISSPSDIRVYKNSDPCQNAIGGATTIFTPTYAAAHGASGYAVQINVSSFSTFYIGSTNVLLPLTSLNFTGKYSNATSNLKWETKSEVGTNHFEVERSTGDGVYSKIGSIEATGSATETTRYAYDDQEAARLGVSRLYYRLKVIDNDGGYTYSNIVIIDIPGSFITRISIFPNPADKQTTVLISSPEEQKITWQLIDATGRSVITKDIILKKGENRIVLNLSNLRTGVYFLKVKGQFVNTQEKIQKL